MLDSGKSNSPLTKSFRWKRFLHPLGATETFAGVTCTFGPVLAGRTVKGAVTVPAGVVTAICMEPVTPTEGTLVMI